jgi:hypothetical protein
MKERERVREREQGRGGVEKKGEDRSHFPSEVVAL